MERSDIQTQYQWDLTDIFPSDEAWEAAFDEICRMPDFGAYRGRLGNAESVLAYLRMQDAYEIALMRVYLYAFLRNAQNQSVTKYISYLGRVTTLFTKLSSETAFALPELTTLPDELLIEFSKKWLFPCKRRAARVDRCVDSFFLRFPKKLDHEVHLEQRFAAAHSDPAAVLPV